MRVRAVLLPYLMATRAHGWGLLKSWKTGHSSWEQHVLQLLGSGVSVFWVPPGCRQRPAPPQSSGDAVLAVVASPGIYVQARVASPVGFGNGPSFQREGFVVEGCAGGCARVALAEQSAVVGEGGLLTFPLPLLPQGGRCPSRPLQPGRAEQEEVLRLRGDLGLCEPPLGSAAAREGKNAQPGLGLASSHGEGEGLLGA